MKTDIVVLSTRLQIYLDHLKQIQDVLLKLSDLLMKMFFEDAETK